MQDNKTNRDKLYTFLTNKGVTGIGANRDEFETIFEDEEKQKKLYDFCVGKGYTGIGKDYDEFAKGFSVQQTAPEQNASEGLKGMAESQGVTMPVDSTLPTEDRNQDIFAGREAMARYADSAQNLRKAQAAYNMNPTAENAEQLDSAAMDFSNVETSRLDAEKEKRTKEELLAERKRLEDAKREAELRLRTRRGEIASSSGMYQMGMAPVTGNQATEITDPEMTKLYAAVNSYDNAIRSVDRKLSGEEPGFWEGVADATVRNPGFYTMGLTDMSDARGMLNIAQNGVEGREDELLADALYSKNAEQQDEDFGFLYRAGNMFGHSVPFMVQTAVTGGFSGASRAGANLAGRLGKKAAESTIKKKIINAMGTTIDDVIEAGLIANTAGAGGTWANIAERKAGKINIKDGDYVFENGESWLGALYKGQLSSIFEYYTEKFGGHTDGKLSLTKGLEKIGASKVSNVLLAAKNSDIYKDMSTVMRQFGLNGFPSEVLEEELNIVLNSLLVGDNKLSELWDPDVQLDIIGGMGLTIGTMQVIPGTIATAGYVKNQYQMNRADRRAADVFGEDWGAIKEALDNATNEKVAGIVAENLREDENHNKALLDYYKRMMIMRGYNIGTVKNETDPEIEEAYTDGFSQEPTGANALNAMTGYDMARQEVARALGLAEGDDVDVFLNGRTAEDIAKGDTDVENAVKNYQQQKARMEGIQEKFQQTREQQYEESDRSIQANDNNGMVYATQLKDEPVFITGGNVVLNEDGTIDVDNSSETLYVKFPDGHVEMTSPDKFTEVFTSDRTADLKAAKRAEIDAKWKAEFDTAEAQSVEQEKREAGVVFDKADAQGNHRIEILNEGEDMSNILFDGAETEISTDELNQWKQEAGVQSADAVADDATDNVAPVELPNVPDFFRLGGRNYEVASRNDDGSVDVMVDGKRETLPAGTDYSTHMPTDKKGEVQYEKMPVERTHEYFAQKVKDDEARAEMIEKRRKKAESERKKFDKKPDPGIDPDAYEAKMTQWEADKKAAQAKVDYWNEVAKRDAEITRSETREAVNNIKPDVVEETADEFIANQLAGIKITPESFKRETGLSNAEQAQLVGVISNDGVSVERAAEIILENYDSELAGLGFTGDVQDVRDIIIDILSQGNPRSYAKRGREAREAENMDQQRADAEAWAKGAFDMTLDELYLYEETILPRMMRDYEGFDENEYYSNLAENNGYDTTRESESIGRGGELLQGEQPVPAGGTPVVGQRNEGGAVSDDVQGGGQNGVAQEEVPVNEPVGNSEQLSSSEIPNNQSAAEGDAPGNGGVYADNQGNPVDADGKLIVDEVNSIDEITDEDFETPARNVQLPAIPENVANAIGTNGRPVVIKKNVFEKNGNTHVELEPEDSRNILRSALYNPNLVGSTQTIRRPDYKVAIRTGEQNAVVVLDVYQEKDFVEIVGWRMVNEKGLAKMQRQAEREGGQFLILSPNDGSAAALSALPLGLSSASEDRNSVSNSQENTQKSGEIAENGGENAKTPMQKLADRILDRTMFRKKDSERRQEKRRINDIIDTAAGFITVGGKKQATKNRLKKEAERKQLAKEMYSSVLKGDFNDVTLSQIDKFIKDATPANPFGRRISQRLPQRMERALRQGARTNAVDALFSRICESTVPANERFSEAGRREIEERKKELLKGWAIATGNWHTDLKEFTDDTEPIGEGKDSKVYMSKDGNSVIKASKGKPFGKKFRPDIDNIPLFNDVFKNSRYEILGYGEIDGQFVRILKQDFIDFAESTPLTPEERKEYMGKLGFKPLNKDYTAFSNGEIVVADLQKGNIVKDAAGNISVIDADAKLHTKDVGGDYTYPPVEEDLPEDSGTRFRKVGNTENNSIFASTYKTEDGKDINYTSERAEGYGVQDDGIGNSNSGSRRSILQRQTDTGVPGADSGLDAEKGEFCVVERVFTENGAFNFTSGEKIESADDVAYIFSALEDAAKEHSFVVYVKDGMPTVVELGMGSFNATMVDVPTASLAYSRINPDHVYFVHNHPSGNLICSSQDVAMLRVFEDMSDVPVTGVIINLKTGKYGTFDTERHSVIGEKRVPEKEVKLAVHTLDKQIFAPDYDPMAQPLVRGSQDVAQFLNSQRMGDRPKVSFLILSRANRIIGNIHTPFTNITTDVEAVARYINERVIQFGGENAILYGDFAITSVEGMDFRLLQNAMDRFGKTKLLDVVRVEGNFTRSANDMGLLYEPEAEYKDGQTMFRIADDVITTVDDFNSTHKGAAPTVIIDSADTLEEQLRAEGFSKEDIAESLKDYDSEFAYYHPTYDKVVINDHDVPKDELIGYLWHENAHRAVRGLYTREEMERLCDYIYKDEMPRVREVLSEMGYKPEELAEEAYVRGIEDVFSKKDFRRRLERGGLKPKEDATEEEKVIIDSVNRIVDFINNGREEERADGRRAGGGYAERSTQENRRGQDEEVRNSQETGENTQAGETRFRTVEDVIERQEENEVSLANEAVTSLGEKLNTPVKIMDNLDSVPENRRKWKGWFDPKAGEVVVVMPNHVSTEDAVQTVLHEVVGHKGLRAVLGEDFDGFLDGVYKNASPKVKRGINDRFLNALRNGPALTVREATEEYIAELAERDFEGYRDTWNAIRQWFRNFFRNFMNMEITDGELRYLLWKNYNRMKSGPVEVILDRAMEANTGTGKVMARTAETYSAVDAYNKSVKGFKNKFKEGWYDEMRSLKKAQEAIEKELGREIMDSENVYLYANHIPSINKNKKEVFDNKYLRSFTSLLKQLYGKEVNGKKLDEKSLERYTNAKHGIERNREMSVKNALTEVQDGKKVFNEKAYKSWAQERDEVREKNLPWAEEQRELDKVAEKYGAKIRDYSGLTAIFDTDKKLKYKKIADAAYQYVADVEKALGDDVNKLWGLLKGMTDYSLNEAFESGLMSKSTYEHIKQMYRYYVPLRGFTEQTAEDFFDYVEGDHSPLNAVVKTAYGRKSEAGNIFATILNMANSAIVQGSKNRLKQRLLNLAMRSQTGLLNVDNAWYAKNGDTFTPVEYPENANEYADFEERMKELEKNGEVLRHRPGLEIGRKVAQKWNEIQHAVRVKRNGREYVVWVNGEPAMANAINGLLREEIGGAIKTVNQFRSKMVTQYSPTFVFTNLLRDVQSASIIYAVRRGTTMLKDFKKNVASNATDMMDLYLKHKRGTLDVNNPKERYFKEFLENGGETGYTEMISIEEYEKKLKELTTGLNIKNGTQRAFEAVGGAVDFANRCVENLCRFSAYQTSREAGISILKSIEDAKEVSVNFNRKGSGAMGQKYAKAGFMFLNPAVQSIAQRILLTKKYPKKMAAVWAGEFILGAAMPVLYSIISAALGDDDDEITGNYYNLSDYRRRSSLCLPLKDGVFHIPLSHESRVLFGLGELCTSFVLGHEKLEDVPIEALNTLAQSLPLNPVEGWMPGKNIIETMTYNFMPDAVKPIAEAVMNRDFAGNTIHNRTDFNEFMPEYMRGKRGTLGVYKTISKYLTSTDGYEKSFLNDTFGALLNPSVMEHLVEGYLGGLYTFGEKAFKAGAWAFGDEEYAEFRNIPIASSFYTSLAKYEDTPKEERTRRDWENAFRFYKDEVKGYDDKEKTAKNGLKHGEEGADLVLEQMERNGEVLMVDIFNDGNDRLKELYGASDAARKNRDFRRVEDIDQQIYAEKRNIVSQMEQLADDPMIGYTFKRNKIEGPYGERETYGDVRDEKIIDDILKELKPYKDGHNGTEAYGRSFKKHLNLYKDLNDVKDYISDLKGYMKNHPGEADECMNNIREKRAEAIKQINNYRKNE